MRLLLSLLLVSTIICSSCEKDPSEDACCAVVDVSTFIRFKKEGANYLDKNKIEKMKVFSVQNGTEKEVNNPYLDYPRGFASIEDPNGEQILQFFPMKDESGVAQYIFSFEDQSRDTLDFYIVRDGGNIYCNSIVQGKTLLWNKDSKDIIGMPFGRSIVVNKK